MSRIYEYEGGNSIHEYLDRINQIHRAPTLIDEFSTPPHTHPPHHNAYPERHYSHRTRIFRDNHQPPAPEVVRKKVHIAEHVEVVRHDKHEEKSIDMQADGFIQKWHRNFESCNTFKGN